MESAGTLPMDATQARADAEWLPAHTRRERLLRVAPYSWHTTGATWHPCGPRTRAWIPLAQRSTAR
jgi:hypothetical protein